MLGQWLSGQLVGSLRFAAANYLTIYTHHASWASFSISTSWYERCQNLSGLRKEGGHGKQSA
jgi:hypothetical protein